MFTRLVYSRKPWTNTSSESIISSDNVNKKAPFTLAAFTQGFVCGFACDFKQCKQMYCTEKLHKAKANQLLHSITLLYKNTQAWSHSARIWFAFVSHLIQSNAFESNASANANADESNANASANAFAAKESSASANANAAFALAFANASAFEHKPDLNPGDQQHVGKKHCVNWQSSLPTEVYILYGCCLDYL